MANDDDVKKTASESRAKEITFHVLKWIVPILLAVVAFYGAIRSDQATQDEKISNLESGHHESAERIRNLEIDVSGTKVTIENAAKRSRINGEKLDEAIISLTEIRALILRRDDR